ncbi:glutamine amidotransferase [Brevifollis gellanilyticus]|uniref:Membrane protein n=1 Tax=Brevifollis gellanilyticus TaxID=748831 RepID=A0A512M8C3_9BACT|nr:glutamine amidotransferase [Brevifollis gellanilyticus]GEP42988.1 membrane protein [Brevifollis gellanilyticus]
MTLTLQHPERLWIAAILIAVVLGVLLWSYRKSPLRGGTKLAAMFCKLAAWSLLAMCVTDPVWSRKQPKTGENEVVIVADNSASLKVPEAPGGTTRAESMHAALGKDGKAPPSWMDELGRMFRVKTQTVDERLQSVTDFSKLDFSGTKSELGRALKTLRAGGAGSRTAAVVLVTDGAGTDLATNASNDPAKQSEGVTLAPVFPVIVGKDEPAPDLRIVEHSVTQTSFEDTPVTITARIAGHGFVGKQVSAVVLDEAGKAIAIEKLKLSKDGEGQTVRLKVPAVKPGLSFYRLTVMDSELEKQIEKDAWKTAAKEATLANNERHIAVDRGAGPYRVLYVSGRPNWEYKFMRRALAGDTEVQIPSLIRIAKREPKFEWRGRTGETSNPLFRGFGDQGVAQRYDQPVLTRLGTKDAKELSAGFPKTAEDLLGEYRAIILDDIEASFFTQEQMNLMERFVSERGGALLMLGGQESFQLGGYDHTPVGRMLPVYLDRVSSAPAIENGRFDLTREGWLEPWTRVRAGREEDEKRLAEMPGFFAVNQTFSIKPGASVLAMIKAGGEEAGSYPALAAQRFGEGRVASVMIGDLWRWGMRDEEARKDLEKAWRQIMRWLVVDVPDRIQFAAAPDAERMKLEVRVRDGAFRAQDDAIVKIEVTGPGGKKSELFAEPSLQEAGLFEAEYYPRETGAYRAVASVTKPAGNGEEAMPLTQATGWVHDPTAAEFASLKPGHEWAERVAKESGGRVLSLDDLPRLPEILKDIRVPVEETITTPFWHAPWVFAVVLALLGTEWFLRRRGGMA